MPRDWAAWPMPSLYELILGLQRHIGVLEGRQQIAAEETRRHLDAQDETLRDIRDRVSTLESRPVVHIIDPPSQAPSRLRQAYGEVKAFLAAVATPQQWVFGAVLVVLTLKGIVEPEIARRFLFGVIGLPPI